MDVRRYKSTGRRSAKIEALVNNPVISSFYRACKFCFGSPSYHENSLEVSQGNFLHRADSPAPDSLAIPMVQVGDALVVACKPLLELTKEHRDIGLVRFPRLPGTQAERTENSQLVVRTPSAFGRHQRIIRRRNQAQFNVLKPVFGCRRNVPELHY